MSWSVLRRYQTAGSAQRLLLSRCQQAGIVAQLMSFKVKTPLVCASLLCQQATFDIYLALEPWLQQATAQWGALAWSCADEATRYAVFSALAPQFDWGWPQLSSVQVQTLKRVSLTGELVAISTALGTFYTQTLPPACWPEAAGSDWVGGLPVWLDVLLARQTVSSALIGQMQQGDVLLIQQQRALLSCHGQDLFSYQIEEETIVLEQAINPSDADQYAQPQTLAGLTLTVEFVLQALPMTVAELQSLAPGQLLSMHPEAAEHILLKVNGANIALGELVEVNGQLGVEIRQLLLAR